jgi:hypothetical protein
MTTERRVLAALLAVSGLTLVGFLAALAWR